MAEGIVEKVGTLLRSNVHALLGAALNLNKLAVFDDSVRELRNAREDLVKAEGDARGRRTTLEREIAEITQEQARRDSDIDRLLGRIDASTDEGAKREAEAAVRSMHVVFNERTAVLSTKAQLLESVRTEVTRIANARVALDARIEMLEAQRSKLEALIGARKAAEAQGKALEKLDINREFSTEGLLREEQAALERAQGRLDARQDAMDTTADKLLRSEEIDAQLAARRARLKSS